MEWIKCSESLPPFNIPVWLAQKDTPKIFIGLRDDGDADGWVWCKSYYVPYFSEPKQEWESDDAEFDDDYQPTHWMPLPTPPRA